VKELLNPELDQEIERIRCELKQIEARISDSSQVRQAGGVPSVSQASAPAIRLKPGMFSTWKQVWLFGCWTLGMYGALWIVGYAIRCALR
jgi:hypothetical protein